ncbi:MULTISPECIES: alpha-glucosidase/alpha-galactosidase [unclassified Paenibacillus]|uniref:alpha-glucosidase/alpha-galactosidase n=1 Tax=unclassified Paenibacillus TaxID=185978 RepID=UPI001AEA8676|nr:MULTISPECIES: alpha-glucosidase/alpha-galactosidase [unclassified Paenibacillus]MBP1153626.1 alpha-galactosidase [Paenibacillus sp. PvP091]MBP1170989.1 alpha-galactosidase [Paenibacillus sp. PvR098]MBP2442017.1 alpha-galactosidase [Paenibacillus sp. PvP052]
MAKITIIGAGSVVFAKRLISDILSYPELSDSTFSLTDIQPVRLQTAEQMAKKLVEQHGNKARVEATLDRKAALTGANYVLNLIQVGLHEATLKDFEIPKKYGVKQTIADTLGIGGVFRALRTAPVMLDFCRDMEEVCPDALLLNYTNPMAMLMLAVAKASSVKAVGLCHSVQNTADDLASYLNIPIEELDYKVAGINHMAWFLELKRKGEDLYPRLFQAMDKVEIFAQDKVRFEMMRRLNFFVTESSEHMSEYTPYFNKRDDLIQHFDIPIDEYIRRSERNLLRFEETKRKIENGESFETEKSHEYGAPIIHSIETGTDRVIWGNVLNTRLITNLPQNSCVEVPCLVNKGGIQPCYVGDLPPQLAAMNMTNINVQQLTVEAVLTGNVDYVYQAVMLDPHTSSVLSLDEIWDMTQELLHAHAVLLPQFTKGRNYVLNPSVSKIGSI